MNKMWCEFSDLLLLLLLGCFVRVCIVGLDLSFEFNRLTNLLQSPITFNFITNNIRWLFWSHQFSATFNNT